jgi:hypothetical protein
MKASVLIDVVAILQAHVDSDREFLANGPDYPLSFEEEFAIESTIKKLESIIEHFQDAIEAEINAYEISQGM